MICKLSAHYVYIIYVYFSNCVIQIGFRELPSNGWHQNHCTSCNDYVNNRYSWWRHQMETFSALLAICAGNSPVPGELSAQRPVTRGFYVFFDLRVNKRLSKQSWGCWSETPPRSLWRHRNYCSIIRTIAGAGNYIKTSICMSLVLVSLFFY